MHTGPTLIKSSSYKTTKVEDNIGYHIRVLRKRCGLTIRKLAEMAKVTPAVISCIERSKSSPNLVTLQNIINALGLDMATFFNGAVGEQEGPLYQREHMQVVSDAVRTCTVIFPKRKEIKFEMLDEIISPVNKTPPFSSFHNDIAGYIVSGSLEFEIKDKKKKILRTGDAFYIPEGIEHRGYVIGDEPSRVITVWKAAAE